MAIVIDHGEYLRQMGHLSAELRRIGRYIDGVTTGIAGRDHTAALRTVAGEIGVLGKEAMGYIEAADETRVAKAGTMAPESEGLAPNGAELRERNCELLAWRLGWPDGALEACRDAEKRSPEWTCTYTTGGLPATPDPGFLAWPNRDYSASQRCTRPRRRSLKERSPAPPCRNGDLSSRAGERRPIACARQQQWDFAVSLGTAKSHCCCFPGRATPR